MESNHAVHLKPFYSHSHISLYNSPVIGGTMPNLSIASGLNLVNASAINNNNNTTTTTTTSIGQDGHHINALNTLQATSANPTLTLPNTAQLMPMTALGNIQFHQVNHQAYIEQNTRQPSQHSQGKFLQVQIADTLPAGSQNNMIQVSQNLAQSINNCALETNEGTSNKKTSNMTEDAANSKASGTSLPATSSTKKTTSRGNDNVKLETPSDNNNMNNKYAIINNGKGFRCLVCDRVFNQKGNLKTHAMTHLGSTERPYDCETCGKRFTQKGNRDIHVKIHTGTKDHTCPYCDRGFTQRGNLKTHIRSVHTGEKPFSCSNCGKTFSQKANMLTHYRTHDKNSRFECNMCGKTFSQKGNLKTHQQRHVQPDKM